MASLRKIDKTLHKNNIYTFVQFILNENETKRIKKNLHKNNQRSTSTSIYIEMYRDSVVLSICCDFFSCCSIAQFFLCGRIKIQSKRAETASPHRNNNKKKIRFIQCDLCRLSHFNWSRVWVRCKWRILPMLLLLKLECQNKTKKYGRRKKRKMGKSVT